MLVKGTFSVVSDDGIVLVTRATEEEATEWMKAHRTRVERGNGQPRSGYEDDEVEEEPTPASNSRPEGARHRLFRTPKSKVSRW